MQKRLPKGTTLQKKLRLNDSFNWTNLADEQAENLSGGIYLDVFILFNSEFPKNSETSGSKLSGFGGS